MGNLFGSLASLAGSVVPAVGAITGIIGAISSNNAQKAANATAQQAEQNQQQLDQQLENNIANQTTEYNKYYQPVLSGLSGNFTSEDNSISSILPQLTKALSQAGLDPATISKLTGINADQISQNATNYLGNTGATNLAQQTPGALGFYQNEANTGINQQYQQNAQNQVQQSLQNQIANAMASAAPGQNVNALVKDLNNQALTQSTNLAGNLAGQSQQFSNTAEGSLLGTAGNLDTQTQNMLIQASQLGQGVNQQAYTNLGSSTAADQGILTAIQNFLGQGQGNVQAGYSPLQSMASGYGTQAQNASSAAAQAGTGVATGINSAATNIGNLFGGGSNVGSAGDGILYDSSLAGAGGTSQPNVISDPTNSTFTPIDLGSSGYTPGRSLQSYQQAAQQQPATSGFNPNLSNFNPNLFNGTMYNNSAYQSLPNLG